MARAMGKAMAQLKHATNDIKVKFKRVEANGLDSKSLSDLTGSFNTQVDKVKEDLIGDSITQANKVKDIEEITGPVKRNK
jgi:sec-independent protein translocase protein TatA